MTDWAAIVADHGPKVWRTVYRILGRHADALDCYQETFLSAYRNRTEPVRDWAAFLTALAARRAIDRLRERVRLAGLLVTLDRDPAGADPEPADAAVAAELTGLVRDRLADLPDRQAEVFWLSCVEGQTHEQIAAQMRTSPGAVRVLLHRARAALAAALNDHPAPRS